MHGLLNSSLDLLGVQATALVCVQENGRFGAVRLVLSIRASTHSLSPNGLASVTLQHMASWRKEHKRAA